jgi:hypothetical protein
MMQKKTKDDLAQPEPPKPGAGLARNPPPPLTPPGPPETGSITPVWPKRKLEF